VIQIKAAKEIKGSVCLPPGPDFLLLAGLLVYTAGKNARLSPVSVSPMSSSIKEILCSLMRVEDNGRAWELSPENVESAPAVMLDMEEMRFLEFVVFLLVAGGKTVSFKRLSDKRFEAWQRTARRVRCELEINRFEDGTACIRMRSCDAFAIPDDTPDADTLHSFLGIAAGLRKSVSINIDYQFSSPLRNLLPAVGYNFVVKSLSETARMDLLSRRLRALGGQKKTEHGLSFLVTADFTAASPNAADISIPGDDCLAGILILAKSLIQRGNLILENVNLETWASPVLALVRKMGCKPAIQETRETSFGRTGMVQLQRFDLSGRKTECSPLYQYRGHIPSIAMLACFSEGQSVIRGLEDLHNDEPDGLARIHGSVKAIECRFGEMPDGIVIEGRKSLDGFDVTVNLPAPISGALAAAGLKSMGSSSIEDSLLVKRWPDFKAMLDAICEYRK
jgi:hypothetical protein